MSPKPLRKLVRILAFLALAAPSGAYANVTFTDNTFNPADYTQTSSFTLNGTIAGSQCASCGQPGAALQFVFNAGDTTQSSAFADLGFLNNTFLYNPSIEGSIVSISASVDKDLSTDLTALPGFPFGNTFRPMIEQGGLFFLAAIPGPSWTGGDTGFLTLSATPLVASDFQEFDFSTGTFLSANPDFSGGPMLFGIGQLFSAGGLPSGEFTAIYDNLDITVTVPEPSSLFLLASALTLFIAAAIRRRRIR